MFGSVAQRSLGDLLHPIVTSCSSASVAAAEGPLAVLIMYASDCVEDKRGQRLCRDSGFVLSQINSESASKQTKWLSPFADKQ